MFDVQEGRLSGLVCESVAADASFLAYGGLPGTPSSPPAPFPRQRQKTRMDTSWTDTCLSPFTYLPLPAPKQPLYRMFRSSRCVGGL